MKKILIIIVCALLMISAVGCGQVADETSYVISGFTTESPGNIYSPFTFSVASKGLPECSIDCAIIVDGERRDVNLFTCGTAEEYKTGKIDFSVSVIGDFFDGNVTLVYDSSVDSEEFARQIPLEIPVLSGVGVDIREEGFKKTLNAGEEMALAVYAGSEDGYVSGFSLRRFDQYKTIDEAMEDEEIFDNSFGLIIYASAV